MNNPKHTPGPWFVEGTAVFTKQGAWYVAETAIKGKSFTKQGDEAKANAHLIAAAPDLLQAVEALENAIGMGITADPEIWRQAHLQARAALNKAKGQ